MYLYCVIFFLITTELNDAKVFLLTGLSDSFLQIPCSKNTEKSIQFRIEQIKHIQEKNL